MPDVAVIAYFGDDPTRVYQLAQWLPVLEHLDAHQPVAVLTRDQASAEAVRSRTRLPVLLAPTFAELTEQYALLGAKVVLYCNNSMRNFESLVEPRMLHVHVNHGESDKQSMASNNAKAYDRVFVAGTAAVERHRAGLLEFDTAALVRVGRPQLDLPRTPLLAPSRRRTLLYAPTWEGDADYNDYCSIDTMGHEIARALLAVPDVRVVYKPHPKVTTSAVPAVRDGHQGILAALARAADHDPAAGHAAITEGDVLAVMPGCGLIVTDVSSVGLDWLYLHTDRPIVMTDRHQDLERLHREVPVSRCADVVDAASLPGLAGVVAARLEHDAWRSDRHAMRAHYFDDLGIGDSTRRFVTAVDELVALRDRLVRPRTGTPASVDAQPIGDGSRGLGPGRPTGWPAAGD